LSTSDPALNLPNLTSIAVRASRLQSLDEARAGELGTEILRIHLLDGFDEDPGNSPVAIVLVVRGD
jgi:hypothetical protein